MRSEPGQAALAAAAERARKTPPSSSSPTSMIYIPGVALQYDMPHRPKTYFLASCGRKRVLPVRSREKPALCASRPTLDGLIVVSSLITATFPRHQSLSHPQYAFSSQGGVYGTGDGGSSSNPRGGLQEGAWDPRGSGQLQSLKELDLQGRDGRAGSKNSLGGRRDRGAVIRSAQDDLSGLVPPVTGSKASLRANGLRKDLQSSVSSPAQNEHGVAGPEEDQLAMGTLFSPSNQRQTRSSYNVNITQSSSNTSSFKSLPESGSSSVTHVSGSGTLPAAARRPVLGTSSTHQTPTLPGSPWAMGNIVKSKEADPKYSDPVPGAPASFQQRLMELAALEAETVRWERGKKVKKKPLRQDKDS